LEFGFGVRIRSIFRLFRCDVLLDEWLFMVMGWGRKRGRGRDMIYVVSSFNALNALMYPCREKVKSGPRARDSLAVRFARNIVGIAHAGSYAITSLLHTSFYFLMRHWFCSSTYISHVV
jgi:hypothetical protein